MKTKVRYMKMKKKTVSVLLVIVMIVLSVLTSCDLIAKPESAYLDENGNVVVVLSDGSESNLGKPGSTPSGSTEDTKPGDPEATGKVLSRMYVNDEKHAIAEYADGTTEDLGYVGVEPPMYTVTFVDINGNKLKEETLYKGKDATAPAAPAVEDKSFDKWDTDFTNVQGDITVKPLYKDKQAYTVTFLDASGNTLKTESVVDGKSAAAPAAPAVSGKVFDGWDTDFSRVTSDLTVKPIYRTKGSYTVTFKDYNGLLLGTATASEGGAAKAPVTPSHEGYTFTGWSQSISKVTKNMTVTAKYKFNGGNNVIDITYELASNNTVKVTYAIKGTVKFAGCDIEVKIPSGLTYKSMTAGDGVVANKSGSSILFNIAGSSNITKETKLATVTYSYSGITEATFTVNVSEMFDQSMNNVKYSVIGKKITLK